VTRLLLDTHLWLWWQMDSGRIPLEVRASIASKDAEVYLSAVSSWEMAIKIASGKLQLPRPLEEMVPESLLADDFRNLPLQPHHCFELGRLPMHHRDPFDRMLIAQARVENLTLVTADKQFRRYEAPLLLV
jgi:PIN domain nuclease of toxin-antitoxin system